jgi:hypothetical protein
MGTSVFVNEMKSFLPIITLAAAPIPPPFPHLCLVPGTFFHAVELLEKTAGSIPGYRTLIANLYDRNIFLPTSYLKRRNPVT